MRKIKIFSDSGPRLVEERVNEWLAEHQSAIIHNTLQSESYLPPDNDGEGLWSLTITIFYYEGVE